MVVKIEIIAVLLSLGGVVPSLSIEARADSGAVEASYYGSQFAGRLTANGEIFDPEKLTAAHPTLPFGSLVEVLSPKSGKRVIVRINDRGPFHGRRAIDLSEAAARKIEMTDAGTAKVTLKVVSRA